MATQVSCIGLGSEAEAREEANAMRATVTKKQTPFIVSTVSNNHKSLCWGEGEKFWMRNLSIYR